MNALDHLDPAAADTVRIVLGRRAPELLRTLEETDDPPMELRQQVKNVLAKEFVSKDGLQPDHEPTPHGRRVDDAIGTFVSQFPIERSHAVVEAPRAEIPVTPILDRESARDILLWGLEDWVDLAFARQYVSDEIGAASPVELREQTIEVIDALLRAGLLVAGDLTKSGFRAWPEDPSAAITRLRAEWADPGAVLHTGDVCWFEITEAGETLARRLREAGPSGPS
ncbi:hypothetical protein ACQPX6_21145 [Actinomycetospora sp. CA-101289]|uniref:hypothetical protein n=1 Tax=Actinomycetospora sp. CA-101289 TaxID=3239893 RepID=UPI003D96D7CC